MGNGYGRVLFSGFWFLAVACGGLSTDPESSPAPPAERDGGEPSVPEDMESSDDTSDREVQPGSSDASDSGIGGQLGVVRDGGAGAAGDTGSTGSAGAPSEVDHCSSTQYPEGETCSECLGRCCQPSDCEGNPDCLAYRSCVAACENGVPCEQGCSPDCPTGSEPVCYFMDCHHWLCAHACGD
jgi:hypothetical protein